MQRFILTACAGLLAAAVASPSLAADLPRPVYKAPAAPIYVAPFSWTGFYVGINGGYGWGRSSWTGNGPDFNINTKGWLAGGTLGYNLQTGSWVWGLETDIDWANAKGNGDSTNCPTCEFQNTWLGTARARVGYAFDRWLPYITGGAAYGGLKMSDPAGSVTKTNLGWTLGAGVEYAFVGAWSAKLEYLYVDLGSMTCAAATCVLPVDEKANFKENIIRLGLNYRF